MSHIETAALTLDGLPHHAYPSETLRYGQIRTRDHSFPWNVEFWAELLNLPISM